jgi:hypothetical protein
MLQAETLKRSRGIVSKVGLAVKGILYWEIRHRRAYQPGAPIGKLFTT